LIEIDPEGGAMKPDEQQFLKDLEAKLWTSANKLLPSLDAAVYKHVVLGLIFLKYISDMFFIRRDELTYQFKNKDHMYFLDDPGDNSVIADELEERDYYTEQNVFWVPEAARWDNLKQWCRVSQGTKLPWGGDFRGVGRMLDDAMVAIEKENPRLKNILNKDYARLDVDESKFAGLIDLISTIPFEHESMQSKDILGHVYEYFLGEFASAEGKKGGQFYTPKSIVSLVVEILEPYEGRVYDPAMGSGGFFVQSEKFIKAHGQKIGAISVYGQESNPTTWRLAAMNMAIRGIDFNFGKGAANTFDDDQHIDLRADYVMANPPFNQKEWWNGSFEGDERWKYGTPPKNNANFAWLQHMLHHLAPSGSLGLLLANGSMSSMSGGEDDIRKALIDNDLVEIMLSFPGQLFTNTQIPACIWFLTRNKKARGDFRDRSGEVLFLDVRNMGQMITRVQKVFSDDEIQEIASVVRKWRQGEGYSDILAFCNSSTINTIVKNDYILTPGRYVGIEENEVSDEQFDSKMKSLTESLAGQFEEAEQLREIIKEQLRNLSYDI
jgi:type I restriction enzyme M protein